MKTVNRFIDTFKIIPLIREINAKILKTNPGDIKCFLDDTLSYIGYQLNKTHFKNKNNWKEFRDKRKEFLEEHICKESTIKEDCFHWINSNFSKSGILLMNAMIKYINQNLIETTINDSYNMKTYRQKLEYMGFSEEMKKISFSKIKEQYGIVFDKIEKEKQNEIDELNTNFLYLRDHYEKFLNEVLINF